MKRSDKIYTLEVDSVELSFGDRTILSSIYLQLQTGVVTAMLGRNGCGKSSLMKIICSQLTPTNISIRLDSTWCMGLSKDQILYLPQHCSIPPYMKILTVFADFNIDYDGFCKCFPEFTQRGHKRISQFSGGEQRIVEVYVILKAKSKFVMLDEPFAQIMPIHVEMLKSLIVEEKKNKGILLSDHMFRHVLEISDKVYMLSEQMLYSIENQDDLVKYGYIY